MILSLLYSVTRLFSALLPEVLSEARDSLRPCRSVESTDWLAKSASAVVSSRSSFSEELTMAVRMARCLYRPFDSNEFISAGDASGP